MSLARLSHDQLEVIKKKMGVDDLWSYSKVSSYNQCHWLFKLKYIDKIKVEGDNIYTWFGSVAHNIIQGFYDGLYQYDQMIDEFNSKVIEWQLLDDQKLKFNSDKERDGYIENLRHYFQHTESFPYKVENEKPVIAVFDGIEKYVFQGYIDSVYMDDEGVLNIVDYKTSSISGFSGKKLLEKARQLIIYAIGIMQFKKIPLDKIRIRFDMMKYCNISYKQRNGKDKVTKSERRTWVAHIANNLRKDLEDIPKTIEKLEKDIEKLERKMNKKKITDEEKETLSKQIEDIQNMINELKPHCYNVIEINQMVEDAINANSLNNMPKFIQEKYRVSNCYIDIELTQDIITEFTEELIKTLDEIVTAMKQEDHDEAFKRGYIDEKESYYCNVLCDMREYCKYYKEYKEHSAMFLDKKEQMSDEELLEMLGLQ